jgi:sugar O-acyltransferase (sialic acid O-acetyltransferase NeuD family)
MSNGASFVMFGQSPLFGDYLDILHACGGILKKVVVNVPDPARPGAKTFLDRLDDANRWLQSSGREHRIAVESIEDFRPGAGERFVIGFRGPQIRQLRDLLRSKYALTFDPLIHPSAVISPTDQFGEGVIVNAGSIIASGVVLGEFCIANRASTVGHDAQIKPFANIGPGANLASGVVVGYAAAIGIGATVIENVTIGDDAFVAAGSVVTSDVAAGTMVAGVPATFRKKWDRSAQP